MIALTAEEILKRKLAYARRELRKSRNEARRLCEEIERVKHHAAIQMDELKNTKRKFKELQLEHATSIDSPAKDGKTTPLMAKLSKLLNPTEK